MRLWGPTAPRRAKRGGSLEDDNIDVDALQWCFGVVKSVELESQYLGIDEVRIRVQRRTATKTQRSPAIYSISTFSVAPL